LLVFPSILKETESIWQEGETVICRGRVSTKDNELKFLCSKVKKIDLDNLDNDVAEFQRSEKKENFRNFRKNKIKPTDDVKTPPEPLKIKIDNLQDQSILLKIKELLADSQGDNSVYFYVNNEDKLQAIKTGFKVNKTKELIGGLVKLLGKEAVK